jgi:hypothetical protein
MRGDPAVLQHIAIVGHVERRRGELLDQQHRHALALQILDDPERSTQPSSTSSASPPAI